MNVVVGTAGHMDHGKTALVKALTGTDADRLPEEKQRGITIDIGFAELEIGGTHFGFVDVPGHERFIKNMLAGATGIDLVMLVIAADEGVMPQTREHFDICRLLGIRTGLIALTKTDLADPELLDLVNLEIAELVEHSFLENAPVIAVSAKDGSGLGELRDGLVKTSKLLPTRPNDTVTLLPVDRSFTVKGFGTVVTGALASGTITVSDEMELMPDGRKVRVRGLQTHGQTVQKARAGQRVAVNLGGIDHTEVTRGMVLSERGVLRPTQIIDAEIEVLASAKRSLRSHQRVRVHIGTVEALARVRILDPGGEIEQGKSGFAQLRLELPVAAIPGERFIIRSYSPQMTIAGGRVIDALAVKHRRKDLDAVHDFLSNLLGAANDKPRLVAIFVSAAGKSGQTFSYLQARTGWRKDILLEAVSENLQNHSINEIDGIYLSAASIDELKRQTLTEVENYHRRETLATGILREALRERVFAYLPPEVSRWVIAELEKEGKIVSEKDVVKAASHTSELSAAELGLRERIRDIYANAKFDVPKLSDALVEASGGTNLRPEHTRKIFQLLLNSHEIVKVSEEFYFTASVVEELGNKLRKYADTTPDRLIDVPKFKEIAGISRKYAIPLLEYFDREKISVRAGDKRLIL